MEFSQEIINVLNCLCGKFGIVIDWTSDNVIPFLEDLCERYIQYEIYTSITWCLIFVAILVVSGIGWGIASVVDVTSVACDVFQIIFFVALAVGFIACGFQVFDIVECYTIPEKTILEYLQSLMNVTVNR